MCREGGITCSMRNLRKLKGSAIVKQNAALSSRGRSNVLDLNSDLKIKVNTTMAKGHHERMRSLQAKRSLKVKKSLTRRDNVRTGTTLISNKAVFFHDKEDINNTKSVMKLVPGVFSLTGIEDLSLVKLVLGVLALTGIEDLILPREIT